MNTPDIANCRTPTKRNFSDVEPTSPLLSSPKFMKPSDIFRKRAKKSQKSSPDSSNPLSKRCKLPLETFNKVYSPLKCLQTISSSSTDIDQQPLNSCENKSQITFSPLMKKLQRSPARNSISFPVVKRNLSLSGSSIKNPTGTLKRSCNSGNNFSRVLDFSEDANFPEKPLLNSSSTDISHGNLHFYPLNAPNIDWSLKTKLRLITNRSIPFHGNFKAVDEATGINNFVRGSCHLNSSNSQPNQQSDNFAAELQRNCLVWQHPSLPWIKLFPRLPDLKPGSILRSTAPVFTISATSTLADALHSDFFLFRASGVAGSDEAHSLISPTTTGLRKLLQDEGIDFTMPFHQQKQSPAKKSSTVNSEFSDDTTDSSGIGTSESSDLNSISGNENIEDDDDDDEENAFEDDDEKGQWLESLGLSQQDFPSLDASSLRRRRIMKSKTSTSNRKNEIDDQTAQGKMKSLVRINGISNCQTLLGLFINNRKICVSNSGPLSGVPPTLLAPVAFHGATLTPISVKQKISDETSRNNGSSTRNSHLMSIDLIGPILPHTLYGLMNLFGRFCTTPSTTGTNNLTVVRSSLRTYDPSSSFALEIGQHQLQLIKNPLSLSFNPTFAVENLEESGLDKRFLTAICTADRQLSSPLMDFELTPNGIRYNRSVIGSGSNSHHHKS